jgi:hypothetical protein
MADEPIPVPVPMIAVQCPACGHRMRARAAAAGKQAACPGCKKPFTIAPAPPAAAAPPAGGGAAPAEGAKPAAVRKPASGIRRRPLTGSGTRPPSGVHRRASGVRRALPRPSADSRRKPVVIGAVAAAVVLAAVLGYVLLAGGGGGAKTPEAAFRQVQTAIMNKDGAGVYDAISPSERRQMEAQWKQQMSSEQGKLVVAMLAATMKMDPKEAQSMSARDFFIMLFSKMGEMGGDDLAKLRDARIVSKRMEGNRCILRVRSGDKEDDVATVKEGGRWYLTGMGSVGPVKMQGSS